MRRKALADLFGRDESMRGSENGKEPLPRLWTRRPDMLRYPSGDGEQWRESMKNSLEFEDTSDA